MITEPTVLILGAGASKPYGFPLGSEFVNIIDKNIKQNSRWKDIIEYFGYDSKIISYFLKDLKNTHETIDQFLETSSKEEYSKIGRIFLALSLINKENREDLMNVNSNRWYHIYVNSFMRATNFNDYKNLNLVIITFNYDRSFEYYIFNYLKSSSQRSNDNCFNIMKSIPIIHLHGNLGFCLWDEGDVFKRNYGQIYDKKDIEIIINNILLMNDKTEDIINNYSDANHYLEKAKKVYIFGVGYHESCMNKLNINKILNNEIEVLGTTYKLNMTKIHKIIQYYRGKIKIIHPELAINEFLNDPISSIKRGKVYLETNGLSYDLPPAAISIP